MVPSRFLAGKDGKTPFEKRRGRKCEIKTEKFGEMVWYKELRSKTEKQNKMEAAWEEGLWLGHTKNSNEVLIGTRSGVVRAFAVRKKPAEEQWDAKLIKEMKGTPAQPNPGRPGSVIPVHIRFDEESGGAKEVPEVREARTEVKPRGLYIKNWMLEEHGFTEDCPGCQTKSAGLRVQKPHSEKCRTRMEEAIGGNERGRQVQERTEERWLHWAAKEMEKDAERKREAEAGAEAGAAETPANLAITPVKTAATGRVVSWADATEEEQQAQEGAGQSEPASSSQGGRPAQDRPRQGKRPGEEDAAEEEMKRRKVEEERRSSMKRALEGATEENDKRRRERAQEAERKRKAREEVGREESQGKKSSGTWGS
jgi:hypothetical protein